MKASDHTVNAKCLFPMLLQ